MSLGPVNMKKINYHQIKDDPPNVVILPWGATEAHNFHLPFASDVIEAEAFAEEAAYAASIAGAHVAVLPPIPFGSDAQQLDQISTIHISAVTAGMILRDVVHSLNRQGIDRLVILNAHGGNEFKPHIRDLQDQFPILIVLVNVPEMVPELIRELFDEPGDHAGALETSLLLHLCPDQVYPELAGPGSRNPFRIKGLSRPGIWTPRPWRQVHPDLGSGNPAGASADKGRRYFEAVVSEVKDLLVNLSAARKGDLPYL